MLEPVIKVKNLSEQYPFIGYWRRLMDIVKFKVSGNPERSNEAWKDRLPRSSKLLLA